MDDSISCPKLASIGPNYPRTSRPDPAPASHAKMESLKPDMAPQAPGADDGGWANLTAGPAGLIAVHVLSGDYVDLLRFRAVCRPWRACSAHLRPRGALDRRFLPRRWVMLTPDDAAAAADSGSLCASKRRRFLNVATGERVRLLLPDLCYLLGPTAEGLLVLCPRDTHVVQLLNPLTGQFAMLPHAVSLLGFNAPVSDRRLRKLVLCGGGLIGDDDDPTVALQFQGLVLCVARPGDLLWTRLKFHDRIRSALPFRGRIYLASSRNISAVETTANGSSPRSVQLAAGYEEGAGVWEQDHQVVFLADNDGELVLFHLTRARNEHYNRRRWSVYRVKLGSRDMLAPLATLEGKALFAGASRALLVAAAEVSPCVEADTVYLCTCEDGSIQPRPRVVACDLVTGRSVEVKFDCGL